MLDQHKFIQQIVAELWFQKEQAKWTEYVTVELNTIANLVANTFQEYLQSHNQD